MEETHFFFSWQPSPTCRRASLSVAAGDRDDYFSGQVGLDRVPDVRVSDAVYRQSLAARLDEF
jgi:hypothetical protein